MRPVRWALLVALALSAAVYAWRTFPRAFSLVSLDLRMDRDAALRAADSLARVHGWAPQDGARQAAVFDVDAEAQTFIELEGGGPEVFLGLSADGRFAAWTWEVRRFRAGEVGETRVRFTPEGRPWSYAETVAEDAPGPVLEADTARSLAEDAARAWGVPLDEFHPLEAARETKPSGRVDHTFVYERSDAGIGQGRLRLRLTVAGDRVTEVTPFVQVPEAFTRRYAQMRSANEGITIASLVTALVLYGALGIGVGLFRMIRRGMLLWRMPLVVGLVIGILQGGAIANAIPMAWMDYDTAEPVATFRLMQAALVVLGVVFGTLQVALSAAAAETLTRAAFPRHPQLWRLWSREAGASTAVLSRTVLGYLLVGVLLAWAVGFALQSRSWQGWWSPTDTLLQPNQLATALPWLGPIALSVQAGVWEECLFRAVPLAAAALLGRRYGRPALWIGGAFVLQALVFASAHASYPAQPAYARVVELILPSFLFGALYLRYGLLPAIILHAGYNLVLSSIPLFVAETPGIVVSRAMVVGAGLLPLGIVLWRRVQAGRWQGLPDALRNAGWVPAARPPSPEPRQAPPALPQTLPHALPRWLVPAGVLGLGVWLLASEWSAPVPRLELRRAEAVRLARDALEERGITLDPSWRVLPTVASGGGPGSRFTWETAGDSTWRALLGDALAVPRWQVRFARFEGDVAERADEWRVIVDRDRRTRVQRVLAEDRPGSSLDEAEALRVADSAIAAEGTARPGALTLVSVEPSARPARTDWEVTWTDTTTALPEGEVRVAVSIAGDDVTLVRRFVHVPEAWERKWRRIRTQRLIAPVGAIVFFLLAGLAVMIAAVVRWARHGTDVRAVRLTAAVVLPVGLIGWFNGWPDLQAGFETAEPWALQAGLVVVGGVLMFGILAAGCAIIVGATLPGGHPPPRALPGALGLGAVLAAIESAAGTLSGGPPGFPETHLDAIVPVLGWVGDVGLGFPVRLTLILVIVFVGDWLRQRELRLTWYALAGLLGVMVAGPAGAAGTMLAWTGGAAGVFLVMRLLPALGGGGLLAAVLAWCVLAAVPGGHVGDMARWAGLLLGTGVAAGLALALRPIRPPGRPELESGG
jgi:hypothetical protein